MHAPEHQRRVLRVPLTPLIDVVFILLLFFMLSSSFIRHHQLEFGATRGASAATVAEPAWIVLHRDGEVSINGQRFDPAGSAFSGQLEAWRRDAATVNVSAEGETPVQRVVSLLDRLREAGLGKLNLSGSVSQ